MSDEMSIQQFEERLAQRYAAIDAGESPNEIEEPAPPQEGEPEPPSEDEPQVPQETDAPVADTAEEAAQQAEEELPDDASDEEVEAARAAAEEEFYAGRYRTREDAERGIAEKDLTIDRLFSERNELRQQNADLAARQVEREQQGEQARIDPEEWQQWAQEAVEQGAGENGAIRALETAGYEGYKIYFREWARDPEQVAEAVAFNNEFLMELADQRAAAAQEQTRQALAPPPEDQARQARQEAISRYPGFEDDEQRMADVLEELPAEDVQYLRTLANQGVEGKVRALRHLQLETLARRSESRARAEREELRQRRSSADAAKVSATVASAEARNVRTPLPEAERRGVEHANAIRREWGHPEQPLE